MRNYRYTYTQKDVDEAAFDAIAAAEEMTGASCESRGAYEWNNALLIAAAKMWGDHPQVNGEFT